MLRLVCATANPRKVAEIERELAGVARVEPRPAIDDVVEDAGTLVGNARLKAAAVAGATGRPAVADDTGLFVDACGGAPGVEAAYWAGPSATYADNVAKAVRELDGVPPARRTAQFRTVAMVVWPDGRELWREGVCPGRLLDAPRSRGWGYEPVFVPDGAGGRTLGELDAEEKAALSHRAKAFRALAAALLDEG